MQEVLFPVIGVSAIVGVVAFSVIIVRFASAFAKRLSPPARRRPSRSGNWGATGGARCHAGTARFPGACPGRSEESSGRALPAKGALEADGR